MEYIQLLSWKIIVLKRENKMTGWSKLNLRKMKKRKEQIFGLLFIKLEHY